MGNQKIREKVKTEGLKFWEIAYRIGVTDCTLSKWLRIDLNGERKEKVEKAIAELVEEKREKNRGKISNWNLFKKIT